MNYVTVGDRSAPIFGDILIFENGHPGTTCCGKDDLYDMGFNVEDIDRHGVVFQINERETKVVIRSQFIQDRRNAQGLA